MSNKWSANFLYVDTGLTPSVALDWGDWSILRVCVRDDGVCGWNAMVQVGPLQVALDYDTGEF